MNKFASVPVSKVGKCSVWLLGAFFALVIVFNTIMKLDASFLIEEQPTGRFIHLLPLMAAALCGIGAFITGLISFIWQKERSILVILAVLVGAFVLFFVIGDLIILR